MSTRRRQRLWRRAAVLGTAGAALLVLAPQAAFAQADGPLDGRPFGPVVETVVRGDLVLAGNSNLLSAGGWRTGAITAADVDGDTTTICTQRRGGRRLCTDNSSSADLDVPTGARVIAARLYVETSVDTDVGPLRAALDGPGAGFSYRLLPAGAGGSGLATKLYEATGGGGHGAVLRQAVWDVTGYVAAGGRGTYTVADVVNERVGPFLPYASWAIVAAYELDPAVGLTSVPATEQPRFASRFVSWHDGFQRVEAGALDVQIRGIPLTRGTATFGRSFHVVAGGRRRRSDNLLFNGQPLGNNNSPGDGPPPEGVRLGADAACNTVTDVQNDSICVLGGAVGTKSPGAADFLASADGVTSSSGSGVDMDVIRIPDGYLRGAGSEAVVQVRATGEDGLAPGVVAVSIDVPASRAGGGR